MSSKLEYIIVFFVVLLVYVALVTLLHTLIR